jgi:hypothetical protein
MAKPIIALPTLADGATITHNSEVATYEAENVQTMALSEKWRTTGDTAEYIDFDLGAAAAITVVAALGTNLTSAATWRIRGATSQGNLTSAPGYDSDPSAAGVLAWAQTGIGDWVEPAAIAYIAAAPNYQWWRIDFADAANPDTYIEVGRVYLSAEAGLGQGFSLGAGARWTNPSTITRTPGGQAWINDRESWRVFDGSLPLLTEAEALQTMADLQRARAGRKDVLLLIDPESSYLMEHTIYGIITDARAVIKAAPGIFQTRFRVEEIR